MDKLTFEHTADEPCGFYGWISPEGKQYPRTNSENNHVELSLRIMRTVYHEDVLSPITAFEKLFKRGWIRVQYDSIEVYSLSGNAYSSIVEYLSGFNTHNWVIIEPHMSGVMQGWVRDILRELESYGSMQGEIKFSSILESVPQPEEGSGDLLVGRQVITDKNAGWWAQKLSEQHIYPGHADSFINAIGTIVGVYDLGIYTIEYKNNEVFGKIKVYLDRDDFELLPKPETTASILESLPPDDGVEISDGMWVHNDFPNSPLVITYVGLLKDAPKEIESSYMRDPSARYFNSLDVVAYWYKNNPSMRWLLSKKWFLKNCMLNSNYRTSSILESVPEESEPQVGEMWESKTTTALCTILYSGHRNNCPPQLAETLANGSFFGTDSENDEIVGYEFINSKNRWVVSKLYFLDAFEFVSVTPSQHTSTAAYPTHQGEYTFDQFKTMARSGQIWQTSNSILRIDKILTMWGMRRISKFFKFKGQWTGLQPGAIKALTPNPKTGKFKSSTSTWTLSRRFSPFLLLKEDVFEYTPEERPSIEETNVPDASNEEQTVNNEGILDNTTLEPETELQLEMPIETPTVFGSILETPELQLPLHKGDVFTLTDVSDWEFKVIYLGLGKDKPTELSEENEDMARDRRNASLYDSISDYDDEMVIIYNQDGHSPNIWWVPLEEFLDSMPWQLVKTSSILDTPELQQRIQVDTLAMLYRYLAPNQVWLNEETDWEFVTGDNPIMSQDFIYGYSIIENADWVASGDIPNPVLRCQVTEKEDFPLTLITSNYKESSILESIPSDSVSIGTEYIVRGSLYDKDIIISRGIVLAVGTLQELQHNLKNNQLYRYLPTPEDIEKYKIRPNTQIVITDEQKFAPSYNGDDVESPGIRWGRLSGIVMCLLKEKEYQYGLSHPGLNASKNVNQLKFSSILESVPQSEPPIPVGTIVKSTMDDEMWVDRMLEEVGELNDSVAENLAYATGVILSYNEHPRHDLKEGKEFLYGVKFNYGEWADTSNVDAHNGVWYLYDDEFTVIANHTASILESVPQEDTFGVTIGDTYVIGGAYYHVRDIVPYEIAKIRGIVSNQCDRGTLLFDYEMCAMLSMGVNDTAHIYMPCRILAGRFKNNKQTIASILEDPQIALSIRDQAKQAYNSLFEVLKKYASKHMEHAVEFNIKIYRVDIPDGVRERLSPDAIEEITNDYAVMVFNAFAEGLKEDYPWIEGVSVEGRSGGWMELELEEDSFLHEFISHANSFEMFMEYIFDNESSYLDLTVGPNGETDQNLDILREKLEQIVITECHKCIHDIQEIAQKVHKGLQSYKNDLESEEFWGQHDATLNPAQIQQYSTVEFPLPEYELE